MVKAIVLLGPPGSGKGTSAQHIVTKYGHIHISTGDMLRASVAEGAELGKKAKAFMDKGELVPDDLIIAMLLERIARPDCKNGYMLDGFPRTLPQAEALDASLKARNSKIDLALFFNSDPEVIIDRMSGRRSCPQCGTVYHVKNNPPKSSGICDKDGSALIMRPDDKEEVVRKRLDIYFELTAPLIQFYRSQGILKEIAADRPIAEVYSSIDKLLGGSHGCCCCK